MNKYDNAVLNEDGTVKSFILSVGGVDFVCSICGANCFHKPNRDDLSVYKCNTCDTKYKYQGGKKMKYTIVWNENKTEGIILSGDHQLKVAEYITSNKNSYGFGLSPVANRFRDHFGIAEKCTIQDGFVPMEPTDEMIKAGMDAYFQSYHDSGDTVEDMVKFIWHAMAQEMNK